MRRMIVVLAGCLLMAGSLAAQGQDRLLPQKKRITDEALARDRALIQTWLARAEALPRSPGDVYGRSRAIALLEFVATEYDRANRSAVLDTSFVHAVAIVERIQSGQTWYETVREPAGVEAVAPGLWHQLDSLQAADVNHCAQAEIAKAQVKPLLAVEEHRTGGSRCSAPVAEEVAAMIEEIKRLTAACAPKPADTVRTEPQPVVPRAPAPDTVRIPGQVHFAFDRATLSPATRRVLDQVAAALVALPDAQIELHAFTDPVGTAAYNRRLSARRGEAVRKYLVSRGIDAARISVVPRGASAPVTEGDTLRERYALDRRVDNRVTPVPNVILELYEQRADLQPTRGLRRPRGSAKASTTPVPGGTR